MYNGFAGGDFLYIVGACVLIGAIIGVIIFAVRSYKRSDKG